MIYSISIAILVIAINFALYYVSVRYFGLVAAPLKVAAVCTTFCTLELIVQHFVYQISPYTRYVLVIGLIAYFTKYLGITSWHGFASPIVICLASSLLVGVSGLTLHQLMGNQT
jgi:hypothetical protein